MGRLDLSGTAIGDAIALMSVEERERLSNEIRRRLQPLVGRRVNDRVLQTITDVLQDEVLMIVAEWD